MSVTTTPQRGLRLGLCVCAAGVAGAELAPAQQEAEPLQSFYIRHYKVKGAKTLPKVDVEAAVYPFMGPDCTDDVVNKAAKNLQDAYQNAGYKTVTVAATEVSQHGVVTLEVSENALDRVSVKGAKYFLPEKIARKAPSLQAGGVPNFNDVTKDIVALNRHPDRMVLPDLHAVKDADGNDIPGLLQVDLKVKDKLPLHGNLELNNRYSPDTSELRVNAGLNYTNLWQAGHTAGFNWQIAPERPEDATVYSAYYILPLGEEGVNLMLTGTDQDSDINTLGGSAVAGKGYVLGAKLNFPLPQLNRWERNALTGEEEWNAIPYFHSLSFGFDFKHFDEDVVVGDTKKSTPIEYYPINLSYGGTYAGKGNSTDVNAGITFSPRGLGSDPFEFDAKRYRASASFFHLRGDLAHTHDLPGDLQVFAKVQGQWANQPLINSEQFSGGGLGNARGYLESSVLGDHAVFGTVELRSPSLFGKKKEPAPDADPMADAPAQSEWRFHVFLDAGQLSLEEPLPEQTDTFSLVSAGAGTRFTFRDHFHGSVDFGMPLRDAGVVKEGDWLATFRLWADF